METPGDPLEALLPRGLLARIDDLVAAGEYASRDDFLRDAVRRALEVTDPRTPVRSLGGATRAVPELGDLSPGFPAEGRPAVVHATEWRARPPAAAPRWDLIEREPSSGRGRDFDRVRDLQEWVAATMGHPRLAGPLALTPESLADTAVATPPRGYVDDGPSPEPIDGRLMFGLHNRDYPSLWALAHLCAWTADGPMPLDLFSEQILVAAWWFSAGLVRLESRAHSRLTALFPSRPERAQSGGESFVRFAVGELRGRSRRGTERILSGPFFAWEVAIVRDEEIAPSPYAYELLESVTGITVDPPHEPERAWAFLRHLRRHAPGDWSGFSRLLDVVADKPVRNALARAFAGSAPRSGSLSTAATIAQGYLGRAREWGLLEPKLEEGRYLLTKFGREVMVELG